MARIVGLQTVIQFAIDFTASLIVARLLSPHEIGACLRQAAIPDRGNQAAYGYCRQHELLPGAMSPEPSQETT